VTPATVVLEPDNDYMNGIEPKIEIIKPFEDSFELMKKILFQPFSFEKWLVIGFAAFLTYFNTGGGFRFPTGGRWTNHSSTQSDNFRSFIEQLSPMWWILIGAGGLLLLTVMVVLMWVRARGHFIFIDCIVRNRAAIVQPWKEYRTEGNSYFIFSLLLTLGMIVLMMAVAIAVILPVLFLSQHDHNGLALLALLLLVIILPILFVFMTIVQFVAPVMYRRRCKAWPAFSDLLSVLGEHPGVFILYFLFSIALGIGVVITMMLAACLTCCIAAIPYVGTVILLPVYVLLQSFSLLFLRQFGSDYDVWAALPQSEPPPIQPPPLPS
jgi:hypothetical protein